MRGLKKSSAGDRSALNPADLNGSHPKPNWTRMKVCVCTVHSLESRVYESHVCGSDVCTDESSSESECESDEGGSSCSSSSDSEVFDVIAEIKRKKAHPDRLHEELWYNDPGQVRFISTCLPCSYSLFSDSYF